MSSPDQRPGKASLANLFRQVFVSEVILELFERHPPVDGLSFLIGFTVLLDIHHDTAPLFFALAPNFEQDIFALGAGHLVEELFRTF